MFVHSCKSPSKKLKSPGLPSVVLGQDDGHLQQRAEQSLSQTSKRSTSLHLSADATFTRLSIDIASFCTSNSLSLRHPFPPFVFQTQACSETIIPFASTSATVCAASKSVQTRPSRSLLAIRSDHPPPRIPSKDGHHGPDSLPLKARRSPRFLIPTCSR
jgi:hypothetical protein